MLTSKQRSYLRSLANSENAIFQVGKNEITNEFLKQIKEALEKRELIKISVLKNSDYDNREAAAYICENVDCECVQLIGNKIVLYKESINNKKIQLA